MIGRMGQQLGNYLLVRFLGRGGFAEVYLGEHVHLNTLAAIKVLDTQLNSEDIEKFHNEAHIISSLKHPHIVEVFDSGIQDGLPFLVMSYAPNGTLRQRHREGSRLPLASIMNYLKQIASALQYAHQNNVIHRDVKPQNMLIGLNEEILLSDFGLAIVAQSTSSQHVQNRAGTVLYMAPEQFQGKAHPASDQYALGVVVYEWLCGECPFHGLPLEIAMQHQFAPPPPLHQNVSSHSTALERVMFKVLAKDPKERFASVQEFAVAFEHACRTAGRLNSGFTSLPSNLLISPHQMIQRPSSVTLSHPSRAIHVSTFPPRSAATKYRKRVGRMQAATLIGLVLILILVIASAGALFPGMVKHASFIPHPFFTAQARVSATARIDKTPTANGVMFGFDAQHTHFNPFEKVLNPANVFRLVLDWSASTGAAITSSPAVTNGVVYVGSQDHNLYAFDAATGKQLWYASTQAAITSSPAVVNSVVYVGSQDHNLYAFNASSGMRIWSVSTGDQITSSPAVVNSVVYVGSLDHNLYAFNASTGKQLWASSTGGQITSSPAVANGVVYVGSYDGKLHAFDASTGKQLWLAACGNWIYSSPAVVNGVVYVGSGTYKLYAFAASTGKLLWAASTNIYIASSPAVTNGVVYIASGNGFGHRGWLYAFEASTGKPRWVGPAVGTITSSPTVDNGIIFIGSNDNNFYALNALTGKPLWTTSTRGEIISSPAVASGVVYVGSEDDHLYAFHLLNTPL